MENEDNVTKQTNKTELMHNIDMQNNTESYDENTIVSTTNYDTLCQEIEDALNIDDPISQKIAHKNILDKINADYKIKPLLLQNFLLTSFKMYNSDDELYEVCINLLLNNVDKLDLSEFTATISDMLDVQKYKNTARELIKLINMNDEECVKRVKRVSFKEEAEIKYIKKETCELKDLREDKMDEKKRMEGMTQQIKVVEFRKPVKMQKEYCKNSIESENQKIREQESILFVNTNVNQKCEPTETNATTDIKSNDDVCLSLPLVNLNMRNVWKSFDFAKIVEKKEFDIKEILNDPKIIDEFTF